MKGVKENVRILHRDKPEGKQKKEIDNYPQNTKC
jgi:hypothetical protein